VDLAATGLRRIERGQARALCIHLRRGGGNVAAQLALMRVPSCRVLMPARSRPERRRCSSTDCCWCWI
jgi:hypothetical protein